MNRRLTIEEIEQIDPERAARIRAYDRDRGKRNRRDPVRGELIRAYDRFREPLRDRPSIAEIEKIDPAKAEVIRLRARNKTYRLRARSKDRAKFMWQGIRAEAKRKGVECDLALEWFETRLKVGVCELSGIGFDLERSGQKTAKPTAPSIDRKIPGGHYTASNGGEDYVLNVFRHVLARRG